MKRYISMFLMVIVCFVMQTTVFSNLKISNIMPNLLVILVAASGFMYGRKLGIYTGFLCGAFADLMYGDIIGISIFIFVLIGYINGLGTKLYFKEDLLVPLCAIALSDLLYGFLYYICNFFLRGRFDIFYYTIHVIVPEMIYTVAVGIVIYKFMQWLEDKLYPVQEVTLAKGEKSF